MANTLGYYNPFFYANEALIQLEKALGMASRVHRGFDAERRTFDKGQFINIRRPTKFTSQAAPASTAQDIAPDSVQIDLSNWREVKFNVRDDELAWTGERMIEEHIRPAAFALADYIDQQLCAQYVNIPWLHALSAVPGSVGVSDATAVYKILFDLGVPKDGNIHYMLSGGLQDGFQRLAAFTQWQGSGQDGVNSQMSGSLGTRYGMEFHANQNTPSHVTSTLTDPGGAVNNGAGYAKGIETMAVDGFTDSTTLKKGDSFIITGNTQRHVLTADATLTTGAGTIVFTPGLPAAVADNAVVTITLTGGTGATTVQCLAYHRNAFAVGFAKLPDALPRAMGVQVASVQDPVTGLALRSRMFYDGTNSRTSVVLDVLFGVQTLDENMAVRAFHA